MELRYRLLLVWVDICQPLARLIGREWTLTVWALGCYKIESDEQGG